MSTLYLSALTSYSQYSVQFMDKTTLGSAAVLGIRYDFFFVARSDVLTASTREGTHLTTNEYVSTLSFEGKVLTVSEIALTDLIGSSFLAVSSCFPHEEHTG